ncbi:MAG: carboxypeptidase regulatory-like domain-containing protein, partial [Acidobacteria bacterium]|nr:carboxypeptidase regulatory-like domain-containing protein [Acidobacteriota bacterium]
MAIALFVVECTSVRAFSQVSSQPRLGTAPPPQSAAQNRLTVTAIDENGVALADARVWVTNAATGQRLQAETDFSGTCRFTLPQAGTYDLRAEKVGFYAYETHGAQLAPSQVFEVTLHHVQEFREQVEVTDSAPSIDPAQTAAVEDLTNREIFSLPYPTTRDYRNVLPFLPGVVQDASGQIHVGGSASYEVQALLDGFTMSQPAGG